MTTEVQNVFTGSLNTSEGTRTDRFTRGEYVIIIAPSLANQGIDVQIDAFLQLEFSDNTQRLIPLAPINTVDTNAITTIPRAFSKGNDRDMYLWIVSDQPYLVDILVIYNTDDDIQDIQDKLDQLLQEQDSTGEEILDTVIDLIRLTGGDVTALLPLLGNVISSLDSLNGVDFPALPPGVDTLDEIEAFYGV